MSYQEGIERKKNKTKAKVVTPVGNVTYVPVSRDYVDDVVLVWSAIQHKKKTVPPRW